MAEGKIQTIVVGVDYSQLGDLALQRSCALARAYAQTELHVVHVQPALLPSDDRIHAETSPEDLGADAEHLRQHVERVMTTWCKVNEVEVPFRGITTHVRADNAAEAIAQLASDVAADLVIVGTHGRRGAKRFLLGSVAESTVRLAPCAVLVVRPADASVPQIQPPCPRCVEARGASGGREMWCEQHRERHDRRHTYRYSMRPGSRQSGLLVHTPR